MRQLSVLRKKFRSAAADGWSSKSPCWLRLRRNWPQFEGPNCHGKAVITDAKCIPARNVAQRPVAGGVDRLLRIGNIRGSFGHERWRSARYEAAPRCSDRASVRHFGSRSACMRRPQNSGYGPFRILLSLPTSRRVLPRVHAGRLPENLPGSLNRLTGRSRRLPTCAPRAGLCARSVPSWHSLSHRQATAPSRGRRHASRRPGLTSSPHSRFWNFAMKP